MVTKELTMSEETELAEPSIDAEAEARVSAENMRLLENIDVALTVEVGNAEIKIRDLLRLNEGSVIELDDLQAIHWIFSQMAQ